jgi:peptidoglycan/LPS O-acetylase OafA/YrhL
MKANLESPAVLKAVVTKSKARPSDEWVLLSGLRFFLASAVLCGHCRYLIPKITAAPKLIWIGAFLGGPPSVYGFFLVSGYSIAASIQKEPHGFYLRRMARICPVYLSCFIVALAAFAIVGSPIKMEFGVSISFDDRWWVICLNAIGLPCIFAAAIGTFGPSWSLTCEIIYYLVAPFLKLCSSRLVLALVFVSFGCFVYHHENDWAALLWGQTVIGLAGFWLAGFLFYRHRANPLAGPLFVGGILAVYTMNWNSSEPYAGINLSVSVLAIAYATHIHLPKNVGRILTYLGEISYPLYLVHFPLYIIIFGCFHDFLEPHPRSIVIYPAAAIIASILIYHVIDRPARKFILETFGVRRPLATMHRPVKQA